MGFKEKKKKIWKKKMYFREKSLIDSLTQSSSVQKLSIPVEKITFRSFLE